MGYSLVRMGRSLEKENSAVAEVKSFTGNESIQFYCADLSSMKAVSQLSDEIKSTYFSASYNLTKYFGLQIGSRYERQDRIFTFNFDPRDWKSIKRYPSRRHRPPQAGGNFDDFE